MWEALREGWKTAARVMQNTGDYGHSILPANKRSRNFYKNLAAEGVTKETPVQLAGALGA